MISPRLAPPLLCAALLAAGCQHRAPMGQATSEDRAACRAQADTVFDKQNREEVYRTDVFAGSIRDSPFSTTGLPGDTTAGLSSQYGRDVLLDDCLRSKEGSPTGTAANPTPEARPPSATPGSAAGVQ